MDGILLDTEPLYTLATQAITSKYGKNYDFSLKRRIMGGSAKEGARLVVSELHLPLSPEEYLSQRRKHLEELFKVTTPIDGAVNLVEFFASHGVPMAVATSSERSLFELKSRPHPWFKLFSKVICGDDPRIHAPKPAPDIFQLAAQELGVSATECLVFEDSPAGVRAAQAAGALVVARRDPALTEEELALAHVIVTNYQELDLNSLLRGIIRQRP
jgi:pseudouridine-5'-monophosphatase